MGREVVVARRGEEEGGGEGRQSDVFNFFCCW